MMILYNNKYIYIYIHFFKHKTIVLWFINILSNYIFNNMLNLDLIFESSTKYIFHNFIYVFRLAYQIGNKNHIF